MKVKALINCVGLGYDLKIGDISELNKNLAEKLIKFGYVEIVTTCKPKEMKVTE